MADSQQTLPNTAPDPGAGDAVGSSSTPAPSSPPSADIDALKQQVAELTKTNAKLLKDQQTAEQQRLEKQGDWQKLAETRGSELEAIRSKFEKSQKTNALISEASKLGLRDMKYLKLVDMDAVTLDGDAVMGAAEAISKLKESDPVLFQEAPRSAPTPNVTPGRGDSHTFDPGRSLSSEDVAGLAPEDRAKAYETLLGKSQGVMPPVKINFGR